MSSKFRKNFVPVLLLATLLTLSIVDGTAQAQISTTHQIPYRGHLELNGVPQSGQFDFIFELYDDATAGNKMWEENFTGVNVANGEFSVVFGTDTANNPLRDQIWQKDEIFLAIQVRASGPGNYTQLSGRQRILAVPYAARSETATNYHVTGSLVVDGGATIGGDTTVTTVTVGRDATIDGNATINGNLVATTGTTTLGNTTLGTTTLGDTTVTGQLTVGSTQASSSINVFGDLLVDDQKPFMWKQFEDPDDNLELDTGISSVNWWAVVAGFSAENGDILEAGTRGIVIRCRMVSQNNTWWIQKEFASHNDNEVWTVDVLFIRRQLVDVQTSP